MQSKASATKLTASLHYCCQHRSLQDCVLHPSLGTGQCPGVGSKLHAAAIIVYSTLATNKEAFCLLQGIQPVLLAWPYSQATQPVLLAWLYSQSFWHGHTASPFGMATKASYTASPFGIANQLWLSRFSSASRFSLPMKTLNGA